jgi:hypothetical protein
VIKALRLHMLPSVTYEGPDKQNTCGQETAGQRTKILVERSAPGGGPRSRETRDTASDQGFRARRLTIEAVRPLPRRRVRTFEPLRCSYSFFRAGSDELGVLADGLFLGSPAWDISRESGHASNGPGPG